MRKIIFALMGMVLMFGIVSAEHSLSNVVGIDIPSDVVAGSEFEAGFSFDYYYGGDNEEGSPLIIRLNITSVNESYPVGKGEFVISGRIEKSWFFNVLTETVDFDCSEDEQQTIVHPLDAQNVVAPDGVFYCYNEDGDLALNEHDDVFLDISSHYAIYPGLYDFSAEMFYLSDERAPFVNITNKDMFVRYYREIDNVLVRATIEDGSGISQQWSSVMINGVEVFPLTYDYFDNGEYYFSKNTPVDIAEADYELFVFAEDDYGNRGNDSVTMKVDRTAPEIEMFSAPSIVSGFFVWPFYITDEKSGVDGNSVEYRLREMDGSNICPEDGTGSWVCYNSGWMPMNFVSGDEYEMSVDSSNPVLNGEYWLEIRAADVLGNLGVFE